MTQPAKGQEPSMEEILTSIRRIIADDPAHMPRPQKDATSGTSAQLNAGLVKESRPALDPVRTQPPQSAPRNEPDTAKPLSAVVSPLRASENLVRNEARSVPPPLPVVAGTEEEADRDILGAVEN